LPVICFLFAALFSSALQASESEKASSPVFYPEFVTSFPIATAVGAAYTPSEKIKLTASYGLVPEPYSNFIAEAVSGISGNAEYEDVIKAAFQNNSLWRIAAGYSPESNHAGWHFIISGTVLNSSGQANIDEVMGASSDNDFTFLKNLLIASGRSAVVDMNAMLQILEFQTGYTWKYSEKFQVDVTFGVAKVIGSDVTYKTNLQSFENSTAGKNLIRSSESDTESVLEQYGITPTLGLAANYFF
jgi:hypothetical protein